MMTDSEALLKERDRLAHEVAKSAVTFRRLTMEYLEVSTGAARGEALLRVGAAEQSLHEHTVAYEAVDRRAQAEATA